MFIFPKEIKCVIRKFTVYLEIFILGNKPRPLLYPDLRPYSDNHGNGGKKGICVI